MANISRRAVFAGLAHLTAAKTAFALTGTSGDTSALTRFGETLSGKLLLPGSDDYEKRRTTFTFDPGTHRHPAAIAQCADAADVARAIRFARERPLAIAVRSGGHDALAASTCDGGLLIDLGGMNAVDIAADGRTVTIGAGVHAGTLIGALGRRGLAVPTGNYPDVGMGGLTLGGGLGPVMGRFGASCDNLRRARVVLADGGEVEASANREPDLFWALKGGGGNFGVATEFTFTAHQLPRVIAGVMLFDGADYASFLEFFPGYMAKAPPELVVDARLMITDHMLLMVSVCYSGEASGAEHVLAPLRRFGRLIEDGVGDMPYAESFVPTPGIARLFAGGGSVPAWQQWLGFQWSGGSIRDFTPQAIAAVRDAVDHAPPCGWAFEIGHHMHGAVCDATLSQSPLLRVRNSFTFHFDAYWDKPDQEASALAWVGASAAALRPHALPTYVNYLSTDAPSAIAEAYGNAFPRLRQIKKHYDPGNVFQRNRNIPPA